MTLEKRSITIKVRYTTLAEYEKQVIEGFKQEGRTWFRTAVERPESDYNQAEIRGYAHVDAELNSDGTYTVKYWDRDWRNNPSLHVVINTQTLDREKMLEDIKERNEFIDRTIKRYESQRTLNNALLEHIKTPEDPVS